MTDRLHVLTATGSLLLTKQIRADGSVIGHAAPKWHKVAVATVSSIQDLSKLLTRLEGKRQSCVVRGAYIGDDAARPTHEAESDCREGLVLRRLGVFTDQPLHSVMFDVDNFDPLFADPVTEPEAAFAEFVQGVLPPEFHDASFHWQLSGSAGLKPGLRGHLWFWLDKPATSASLRSWAPGCVDASLFNPIQAHYTANPVFDAGVVDPVPVRSGFVDGLFDSVSVEVPEVASEVVDLRDTGLAAGDRVALTEDPIVVHLERLGMVKSVNRTRGGLNIVCPNAMEHSGESGETSTVYIPAGRGYEVGNFICQHSHCREQPRSFFTSLLGLDRIGIDTEGFEEVSASDIAAVKANLKKQAEVSRELVAERLGKWLGVIDQAADIGEMQNQVGARIAADKSLGDIERNMLAQAIQTRLEVIGAVVPIAVIRKIVAYTPPKVERQPTVKQSRPLTEFGMAERMLDRFGESLMYVPEMGSWYIWTGVYWRPSVSVEIEHYAKETVRRLVKEADDIEDEEKLGAFFEFARNAQRATMVKNMVTLAASEPKVCVPARELDKHRHLLGVRNGVVDLRTGVLLDLPPEEMKALRITLVAGCDYKPDAKAPLFSKVLRDAFFDDAEMAQYALRLLGYALQGDPKEDFLCIPFGNGANGKSTILNIARQAFGAYAKSADAATFISDGKSSGGNGGGPREDLYRLRGARLVYVSEPDEGGELREGTVKAMTGGDAITARAPFGKSSVEFVPTWLAVMPTNHKPIIKGSDNGIWRRMELIPFERNFNDDPHIRKDENLREKLAREIEGVLTLIVKAGRDYLAHGLSRPQKVVAARAGYREQMDLLAEWLETHCEVGKDFECSIDALWQSWKNFAENGGILKYVPSKSALGRRLDSRFLSRKGTGGIRLRVGLRLKQDF